MTSPAIRLAKECDAKQEFDFESDTPLMAFCELLVAKAQAQALREAADLVQDDYGCDVDSAAKIRRMAAELERKA